MSPMPAGRFAGLPERGGDDADRVHPGGLALVVGGADRGVALDVLHGAHAGTGGAEHIGHGLVALEVHEVVVPVIRAAVLPGYQPELAGGGGRPSAAPAQTARASDSKPAAMTAAAPAEMPSATQSSRSKLPRPEPATCWLGTTLLGTKAARSSSQRSLPWRWECRCTTRGPAAGDGQQVAGELFDARGEFAGVVDAPDGDAEEPAVAGHSSGGVGDGAADQHPRSRGRSCGSGFASAADGRPRRLRP